MSGALLHGTEPMLKGPFGEWISCPIIAPDGLSLTRFRAFSSWYSLCWDGAEKFRLALVPGGSGFRGTGKVWSRWSELREVPIREVTLRPFLLSTWAFTSGQWLDVSRLPGNNLNIVGKPFLYPFTQPDEDRWPVEILYMAEALELIERLRRHTGLEFRLASETEWEYACRAGTTSKYHFGKTYGVDLPSSPVIARRLRSVGSMNAPNRFGLHDMHGPVGTWCTDWAYPDYSYTPVNGDPLVTAPADEEYRIVRGTASLMGSAGRDFFPKRGGFTGLGLRLALAAPREFEEIVDPTIFRIQTERSVASNEVVPGETIKIHGRFFQQGTSTVSGESAVEAYFDDTASAVVAVREDQIQLKVPASLPRGTTGVQLVVRVGLQSSMPVVISVSN